MSITNFKMNGVVSFTYDPGFKKVPEFGVYVLGEPTPSVDMMEEVIHCVQCLIDDANGVADEDIDLVTTDGDDEEDEDDEAWGGER